MSPGERARAKYEKLRNARIERARRNRRVILGAIIVAFGVGFFLPGILIAVIFGALAAGFPLSEWSPPTDLPLSLKLLGGTLLASGIVSKVLLPSRSEVAWGRGAAGEIRVGKRLARLTGDTVRVIHDLGIPGSQANIDHIAVTRAGVFVIDTKSYRGRLEVRRRSELWIAGRNRTGLVDGVKRQAQVVEAVLSSGGFRVQVVPVLCFVRTDIPLLASRRLGDVMLTTPRGLRRYLDRGGKMTLAPNDVRAIETLLRSRFAM